MAAQELDKFDVCVVAIGENFGGSGFGQPPSMPAGSPGMEVPDGTRQSYQVIALFENGRTSVVQSVAGEARSAG